MARPFVRAEVWTDVVGNSGVRKIVSVPCLTCQTVERFEGVVVTPALTLTVRRDWSDRAELVVRRVIRLLFDDGSFDEYRISGLVDGSGDDGIVTVTGAGMILDLAEQANYVSQTASPVLTVTLSGSPTACLTTIDGFSPAWWAVGTVTPSSPVEVPVTNATPLAAAIAVAQAANALTGVVYELSARRNGTSGYYLDLTVYNAAAAIPDVRTGKNLVQVKRDQRTTDLVTRVVPLTTDGGGIAENYWRVSAVTVNTFIEVQDLLGGLSPLLETNALDGKYILDDNNGTHQITTSTVIDGATARFAMASTTDISVGDRVRIVANSSRDPLLTLDGPTAQAVYGIRLGTIPATLDGLANWIRNPDLANWAGAAPDDWTQGGGGVISKLTGGGQWLRGGAAVSATGVTTVSIERKDTVYIAAATTVNYAWWFWSDGVNASELDYWNPDTAAWVSTGAMAAPYNTWNLRTQAVNIATTGQRQVGLRVFVATGNRFDSGMAIIGANPGTWRRGANASVAWLAGVGKLRSSATAPKTYTVALRDLHRFDPTIWSGDQLVHGGTCNMTDSDLGETAALRAVSITTNHLQPLDTQVIFATRVSELTALLLG